MGSMTEAIRERRSCRDYSDKMLEEDKLEKIRSMLAEAHKGPFGCGSRFQLLDFSGLGDNVRGTLGTYGFIRGARFFIAGAAEKGDPSEIDYGYCFERIILRLTGLGLGTCWLAGTFKRSEVVELIDLKEGEYIPAVSPIGYPSDKGSSLMNSFIRFTAGSDKRKPWESLFFSAETGDPLPAGEAGRYADALECVRLAPSGSNMQPWRLFKEQGSGIFHFYTRGKLLLDMGIAMAHFELCARENGISGRWVALKDRQEKQEMRYIASWAENTKE